MTDFTFDGSKRFPENCAEFLKSTEDIDPEMANLLKANWDKLLAVVHDGERDAVARTTFNEGIAAALDHLLTQETDEESE